MKSTSQTEYELIKFTYLNKAWYYTSTNADITYDNDTYLPSAGAYVSGITITDDFFKTKLNIKISATEDFTRLYIAGTPDQLVYVTVFRYNPITDTATTFFKGEVHDVTITRKFGEFTCNTSNVELSKNMMSNYYQKYCRHIVYDGGCRLGRSGFTVIGNITSLNNNKVIVSNITSVDDQYYVGGDIIVGEEQKTIVSYDIVTKELTLMNAFSFASVGDIANVAAGCNHTPEECIVRQNIENYGGVIYIPDRNPQEGLN